mmetsp:Transcript_33740/g.61794  ORF Transcript_33740/g.61794 Transcript_33740/m.61794 type:complete len:305 (+) Transcript_33740:58-972(+)
MPYKFVSTKPSNGGAARPLCDDDVLQQCCDRTAGAVANGSKELGILMLPGSFNPVHLDHIQCLRLAKKELENNGIAVVASFLQPSSDSYVSNKLGADQAMYLQDRIEACNIAARDVAPEIGVWCSGEISGARETTHCQKMIARMATSVGVLPQDVNLRGYMVCGADFVERACGRQWCRPAEPPKVVIQRHGSKLPWNPPGEGWYVVKADPAGEVSSTLVRKAIHAERWDELTENGWATPAVREFLKKRYAEGTLFMEQVSLGAQDEAHNSETTLAAEDGAQSSLGAQEGDKDAPMKRSRWGRGT